MKSGFVHLKAKGLTAKALLAGIMGCLSFTNGFVPRVDAGEPCCHILVCCRDCDAGITWLVDDQWQSPNYRDIDHVRDIMQKIKDAGIKTVIVDMTNRPQWLDAFEEFYRGKIDNIEQVCEEKDMKFFIHIGHAWSEGANLAVGLPADAPFIEGWGVIAQRVWDLWAQKPTYKKYGYGDDRPILGVFEAGADFWPKHDALENKRGYPLFHIGTMIYNVAKPIQESDGWGYRNSIENPSGTVRYTSPLKGLTPGEKITPAAFATEVEWAMQASHYSIYGSYDDTCDGIHWGIADTAETTKLYHYPDDNPWVYYDILQEKLTGGKLTFSKTIRATDFSISSEDPATASLTVDMVSGESLVNVTFTMESTGTGRGALQKVPGGWLCIVSGNPDYIDGADELTVSYTINSVSGAWHMVSISEGFSGYAGDSLGEVSVDGVLVTSGFETNAFNNGASFQAGDQTGGTDPRIRFSEFYFGLELMEGGGRPVLTPWGDGHIQIAFTNMNTWSTYKLLESTNLVNCSWSTQSVFSGVTETNMVVPTIGKTNSFFKIIAY